MHMAISSWNSSLAAYGRKTCGGKAIQGCGWGRRWGMRHTAAVSPQRRAVPHAAIPPPRHSHTPAALCPSPTRLHDAGGVLAGGAVELALLEVGYCHQAAGGAHVHAVRVALVVQPLLWVAGWAVAGRAVTVRARHSRCTHASRVRAARPRHPAPTAHHPALTLRKAAAPCEMMQSRSISPKRRPPSRARPSTGCRVRIWTGPRPLRGRRARRGGAAAV